MDERYTTLASQLVGFSTTVKRGDHVLIDAFDVPDLMVVALIRAVRKAGGVPHVNVHHARVSRELLREGSEPQFKTLAAVQLPQMRRMQVYIALRGADNIFENSDIPAERMTSAMRSLRPVLDYRVKKTRWCVLRWPTPGMAQQARMSTEAFEDFYFKVCTLDYSRMLPGMKALKQLMDKTKAVAITGPGTNLRFSIEGIGSVCCGGRHNIPDGEVFTAPVKNSVEGHVTFNVPTVYQGTSFDSVRLTFKQGRIVEASANETERLNQILDSDAGARFIGEFAIGFNPHILQPMRDILFDEKIAGSFHFTPGQAYEEADNGNRSQVHWDMVNIQRPEFGGGEIRFDGKVIRRDGLFLPPALRKLNPQALLSAP